MSWKGDILVRDSYGRNKAHRLAVEGEEDELRRLGQTERGREAMLREDNSGSTPVTLAAFWGHAGAVEALLAYAHPEDGTGTTAIHEAARSGEVQAVRAAVEGSRRALVPVDKRDAAMGRTALQVAAGSGQAGAAVELLERGACARGLKEAASVGRADIVGLLLARGASTRDNLDEALSNALSGGSAGCVQLLADQGADIGDHHCQDEERDEAHVSALAHAREEDEGWRVAPLAARRAYRAVEVCQMRREGIMAAFDGRICRLLLARLPLAGPAWLRARASSLGLPPDQVYSPFRGEEV